MPLTTILPNTSQPQLNSNINDDSNNYQLTPDTSTNNTNELLNRLDALEFQLQMEKDNNSLLTELLDNERKDKTTNINKLQNNVRKIENQFKMLQVQELQHT